MNNGFSTTAIIVSITVLCCVAVIALCVLAIVAPDSAATLFGLIAAFLAASITPLLALLKDRAKAQGRAEGAQQEQRDMMELMRSQAQEEADENA